MRGLDTLTHRTTTVTLAAHARRGLISGKIHRHVISPSHASGPFDIARWPDADPPVGREGLAIMGLTYVVSLAPA